MKTLKRRGLMLVAALLLAFNSLPTAIVNASTDNTPPVLNQLQFSSTTVDVTQGRSEINVELHASDIGTGIRAAYLRLYAPQNKAGSDRVAMWTSDGPSVWRGTISFDRYIASGDWTIYVSIVDWADNNYNSNGQQLVDEGFPGFINVVSDEDQVKPTVSVVDISQTTVDVTTEAKTVDVRLTSNDDVSGVWWAAAIFTPEGGGVNDLMVFFAVISDANGSKQWDGTVQFPQHIKSGFWNMRIMVEDRAGNTLSLHSDELESMGFDGRVNIISNPDTIKPVLVDFNIDTNSVETSNSDQTVTATLNVDDDMAGIGLVNIALVSPSGPNAGVIWPSYSARTENGQRTTWTATYTIPKSSETGQWKVAMYVADKVHNYFEMKSEDLALAGHSHSLNVTNSSGMQAARTQSFYGDAPVDPSTEEAATMLNGTATEGLKVFYAVNNSLLPVESVVNLLFPIDTTDPTYATQRIGL